MDFNHLKPVLDDRAVPERRQRLTAAEKEGRGGLLVLVAPHGGSLLLVGLLCGLGDLSAGGGLLLHGLDDAHSHGLPHVAHGEAACEKEEGGGRGASESVGWGAIRRLGDREARYPHKADAVGGSNGPLMLLGCYADESALLT